MIRGKLFFGTLLLLLLSFRCFSQNTTGSLAVQREEESDVASILRRYNPQQKTKTQADLLIKVAHILWSERHRSNTTLDSCLNYSTLIHQLSEQLKYAEGISEGAFLLCKVYLEKKDVNSAKAIISPTYGETRCRLLLILAEYYVFKFEAGQPEFQLVPGVVNEAILVSKAIRSEDWYNQSQLLLGKYHFKNGNMAAGKEAFLSIIRPFESSKNYAQAAHYWSELGKYTPENLKSYQDITHSHEKAVRYFMLAGLKKDAAYSLRDLAVVNANHNQIDSSEKQLMRCLSILRSIKEKISLTTYFIVGDFYRFIGHNDKALFYALEGIKQPGTESKKTNLLSLLAIIYYNRQEYDASISYYQRVLDVDIREKDPMMFFTSYKLANVFAESGKPQAALRFLNNFIKEHPPFLLNQRQLFDYTFGHIYSINKEFKKAEVYYQRMLSIDEAVDIENGKNLGINSITLTGGGAYFAIGKFYADWKRYDKAGPYLRRSLQNPQFFDKKQALDTYRLLSKVDSASGDYLSALKNYQRFTQMNDSVNNVLSNQKFSELNVRFKSEQRLKDIKMLQKNERLQKAELKNVVIVRNVIIGGAILFFAIAVISSVAYNNKRKSNALLARQKDEIQQQKTDMQVLLNDKERLLSEKEDLLKDKDWLLKEIHHRVKNNLQIVISLLNSQSKFLVDPGTIDVFKESQNRIFSISLIHQKLYQDENVSGISVRTYISELISHLSSSFGTNGRISFKIEAENLLLDVAQAVPIGLVMNEAITNSIKYAFPEDGKGFIHIVLKRNNDHLLSLEIADNGIGLPSGYIPESADTLGMSLMRGLTEQLDGSFQIEGWKGVRIGITWKERVVSQKH